MRDINYLLVDKMLFGGRYFKMVVCFWYFASSFMKFLVDLNGINNVCKNSLRNVFGKSPCQAQN